MSANYNAESIQTLAPLEAIRKRLGMYAGSADNQAVHHCIKEAISNGIDEYLAGWGAIINIDINDKTNTVSIRDYGRGIPPEKLDDALTKLHTSGKFVKEGAAYGATGGTNGVGIKILTATGKVVATVFRKGMAYKNTYHYTEIGELKKIKTSEKDGTLIEWTPDTGVFSDDNTIYYNKVLDLVQDLSYPTPGLKFVLSQNGKKQKEILSNSLTDFIKDYVPDNNIISPIMTFSTGDNYLGVEAALAWSKGGGLEQSYLNLIPTKDGGTHVTALKTVLTRELNKFLKSDLKGDEIRRGLVFILSVKTIEDPVFKGQNKDALNMPMINAPLSALLKGQVELMFSQHKDFFEHLEDIILQARKKEESVNQIREVLIRAKGKANPIPNKLKPALATKGAELFITEGLSASGSLISHRDVHKHAIMSLKGKPINVLKHDLEKVLKNDEIKDLIIAMGGFGDNFTADKCIYDKIVILTDQDTDGSHINLLLLTFFYTHYPQLIRDGKIYSVDTPLYTIKQGNKTRYVFSELEMEKLKTTLPKTATYFRAKGLGELDPEVLAEFVFSNKRVLKQYTMDDEDMVRQLLENFMGQDGAERREFVS